jgi:hypothetical protein
MHGVIRSYSGPGAKELFDLIVERTDEVEELIRGVPGFVSYTLIRTGDGGTTVTVCRDKSGTDESVQRARDWIAANGAGFGAAPPVVTEGGAEIYFTA